MARGYLIQSDVPRTSFPHSEQECAAPECIPFDEFCDNIQPLLVVSDARECNENLLCFLKLVIDYAKTNPEPYHTCSVLALRFLNLNLFTKNFHLCLAKLLSLVNLFGQPVAGDCPEESHQLKELLLIILLLLFKLTDKNQASVEELRVAEAIDLKTYCRTLADLNFMHIYANFISFHTKTYDVSHPAYVLLKFSCDIVFQYLFHVILLSDDELDQVTNSELIPTLIDDLLSNDNFNNYDLSGDDFEDVSKMIAYEEFKLLLLINEQCMMKSLSSNVLFNTVMECLLDNRKASTSAVCGFTNLLVYHLNREESHIVKILMLKFLYVQLNSQRTAKSAYLNDLKILVDIIIRELNNLDYSATIKSKEVNILALTYMKVLYPLLTSTQLNDVHPKYKAGDLVELLSNVIMNCETDRDSTDENSQIQSTSRSIVKTALKCLSIPWLKSFKVSQSRFTSLANTSSESLSSLSSLGSRVTSLKLETTDTFSSTESFSINRVASVRASSVSDYNKHTASHNSDIAESSDCPENIFEANNHNVFIKRKPEQRALGRPNGSREAAGLLDLPREYLHKKVLPPLPLAKGPLCMPRLSTLQQKAQRKRAPPPPPPPPRRRH